MTTQKELTPTAAQPHTHGGLTFPAIKMNGSRSQDSDIESFARENATMITQQVDGNPNTTTRLRRTYKCKDCDKEYDNFQALGGHRASHMITRPNTRHGGSLLGSQETPSDKLHVCRICQKGFPIGQALGGHMRKHRSENINNGHEDHHDNNDIKERSTLDDRISIVNRSNASSCSSSVVSNNFNGRQAVLYDLNLTPEENKAKKAVPLPNQMNLSF